MAICTGHCWVRVHIAGRWYLQCINCQSLREE